MNNCAICNHGPHPTNQHRYMTWTELEAHHTREDARHPATGYTEATYVETNRPY